MQNNLNNFKEWREEYKNLSWADNTEINIRNLMLINMYDRRRIMIVLLSGVEIWVLFQIYIWLYFTIAITDTTDFTSTSTHIIFIICIIIIITQLQRHRTLTQQFLQNSILI